MMESNPPPDPMFIINCLVDLIFVIDMVLQFFLMYPVKTKHGMTLEYRHKRIVVHYLRGWFTVDILSILPFGHLGLILNSDALKGMKIVKVVRLLRLLKLMRILKASRVFRRIELNMSVTYHKLSLLKFFIILILMSHWLACMWALSLTLVEKSDNIPRWVDSFAELEKNVAVKTEDSVWKKYIASLYFTSYTITSVGYGDIGPQNIVERIVCTAMIFIAGISWAYVLGQVCGIVGSMNAHEQDFRNAMDDLNHMMQDRGFPPKLRRRLRSFFISAKDQQRHNMQQKLFLRMSPCMHGEVAMATHRVWLGKVSFLRGLLEDAERCSQDPAPPPYIVDLAIAVRSANYAQSEVFGKRHTLYILKRGFVGRRGRVYNSGKVWGYDFVLSDVRLQAPVRSFALTYVEASLLDRDSLMRIVEQYREEYPQLSQRVRRFRVRMVAQRGFIAEAQRRRLGPRA